MRKWCTYSHTLFCQCTWNMSFLTPFSLIVLDVRTYGSLHTDFVCGCIAGPSLEWLWKPLQKNCQMIRPLSSLQCGWPHSYQKIPAGRVASHLSLLLTRLHNNRVDVKRSIFLITFLKNGYVNQAVTSIAAVLFLWPLYTRQSSTVGSHSCFHAVLINHWNL